jgi:hypothetical protein
VEQLEERAVPDGAPLTDRFLFTPVPDTTPLAMHIHPHLTIFIDGKEKTVPAGIGIEATGDLPLHTHDASGKIHVESPVVRTFCLEDFFAVWGQTFDSQQILGYHADAHHVITMTVDGRPSEAFGSLPLKDGEQIVIRHTEVAGPHPHHGRTVHAPGKGHSGAHRFHHPGEPRR